MNANDMHIIRTRQAGVPKIILIDEAIPMYDGLNDNIIIFDQDNEMAHSIHRANSPYVQQSKDLKYEVETFKYDSIVTVKSFMSEKDLSNMLDTLITESVITVEDKDGILESFKLKK